MNAALLAAYTAVGKSVQDTLRPGQFQFNIISDTATSAGIYKIEINGDDTLVRTLWSAKKYTPGKQVGFWDLKDDDGNLMPLGNYKAKVLKSNNASLIYEGGIGNTSRELEPANRHRDYFQISCMAFTVDKGFYGRGSSEGQETFRAFLLNDIQRRDWAGRGGNGIDSYWCTTDGINIYYGGQGGVQNPRRNVIVGVKASDYSNINFSNGTILHIGSFDYSVLGLTVTDNNPDGSVNYDGDYTGFSAQRNNVGKFLFVSQAALNRVLVFDLTQGGLQVQTLNITGASVLDCSYNGKIWIASKIGQIGVSRYTINQDGSLTSDNIFIPASDNIAISVSPLNNEIKVQDVATQQIKVYNESGILSATLGELNGHANGTEVIENRFSFTYSSATGANRPFISHQPDGSFWFSDNGHFRVLKYNPDLTYNTQIAFIPSSRATFVNVNDNSELMANYMLYKRNFTKPLAGLNGSWKLSHVFHYGLNVDSISDYDGLGTVFNMAGKRFSFLTNNSNGRIYELGEAALRDTGIDLGPSCQIRPDGVIEKSTDSTIIYEAAPTGLDSNGNPTWSSFVRITPDLSEEVNRLGYYASPFFRPNNTTQNYSANPQFYTWWNNSMNGENAHLGIIKRGRNKFKNLMCRATRNTPGQFTAYKGDYPVDGTKDNSNYIRDSAAPVLIKDSHVFQIHGKDFWKDQSFAESINWFDAETGLHITSYKKTWQDEDWGGEIGLAANILTAALASDGLGNMFVHTGDEVLYGHIHSVKASGAESISVETIPLLIAANPVVKWEDSDMMQELPYRSASFTSGFGWTVPDGYAGTNLKSNAPYETDLYFYVDGVPDIANAKIFQRALGATKKNNYVAPFINKNNWTLSGEFAVEYFNNEFFELLDSAGKKLVQISFPYGSIAINENIYYSNEYYQMRYYLMLFRTFVIKNVNGIVSFSWKDLPFAILNQSFEAGGNFNQPKTFQIRAYGSGNQIGKGEGSIRKLNFK